MNHPDSGDQLVEEVVRNNEAFEGWMTEEGPDIIVRTVPNCTLKAGYSDSLLQPSAQNAHDRSGDHRQYGIILASGPSFGTGSVDGASILDIAPTLLYLHHTPIPIDMDGKVLSEIVSSEAIQGLGEVEKTEEYGESWSGGRQWSEDEEDELEQRLSNMGYLS